MLDFDSDICVCFHVRLRKLWHYTRREQPRHYTQLTDCLGAGTGCQSCVPLLKLIHELAPAGDLDALLAQLSALEAARDARRERKLGGGAVEDGRPTD